MRLRVGKQDDIELEEGPEVTGYRRKREHSHPRPRIALAHRVDKAWGKVLICGGTDWPKLGRKDKGGKSEGNDDHPDLLEPHILRSLSNVHVVSVHASCAGCHFIAIDAEGNAWLFGRNQHSALGISKLEAVSENAPRKVTAAQLGAAEGTKLVWAACGRGHTILVGSDGNAWSAGLNVNGQCGHAPCPEISSFRNIKAPVKDDVKERFVKAAAGISFSLLLTASGRVYACGSGEHGQLGNGRTGEHIVSAGKTAFEVVSEPLLVRGLDDRKIVDVSCGQQHSVALDSQGLVYVWGYNGYCRLGLGNQQDVMVPKVVPQYAGPNEITMGSAISAGPTSTVVIDKQGMYWMAGKWKNTGDGSGGQPYSTFRYMQDIMGCKITHAASGGVTHFALCPEEDGTVMTIAYGQNAGNGELGLGSDQPKSATKPTKHVPLEGVDVFQIAAGQNTTLFLARSNEKLSELPRHPEEVDPPEVCVVCNDDKGEDVPLLECEKCDHPYHLQCLDPPLQAVPDGEWFCPDCEANPGAPVGPEGIEAAKAYPSYASEKPLVPSKGKRARDENDEDGEDAGDAGKSKSKKMSTKGAAVKRKK
ncbi:RCC1/BLIP-II [Punctularia strigosozonata HHB-11173 SS5]|uniref:RCC1/BLIP-II n=1 Tax=Punctularia strigosozonata (strain HHB-11173) TaxID=741275 RepID=UPI0004418070|nr:RCC1/BLIP-II [Punctularia strigosozonata HHB-11173 SS5]EIN06350.1 RCC1/BLIP-II [Punctularia strigosozonata HHB-11173 SS5]